MAHPFDTGERMEQYTQSQKEIAEKTQKILLGNLERHITIGELAQELHVSQTQIKVCFHKVYGMPGFAYTRKARMEAAALQLRETQDSVLEIAGQCGYENGSKFATAFRSVIGLSPSEYRRRCRWDQDHKLPADS